VPEMAMDIGLGTYIIHLYKGEAFDEFMPF